jgi:hypothetical protein
MDEKTRIRNGNARLAQSGASNPVGLIKYLDRAMEDFRVTETKSTHRMIDSQAMRNDPAMRLIVHQLAYLFKVDDLDMTEYAKLTEAIAPKL